jgi:multidrug efflux system membrane fusion protein
MAHRGFLLSAAILVAIGAGAYSQRDHLGALLNPAAVATAKAATPPFAMPAPIVRIVKKTIPITLEYPARIEALQSVTLQAKVTGFVTEQSAPDGADVKKGDLLYRIDPRDYQIALDQANAQVQRDSAALDYARASANRGVELSQNGNLAKDTVEQRASAAHQAEAALLSDKAAARAAELNLGYTEIRAPYDGRLGRNQAPVGALISSAGVGLNTLVQLDPLYVVFNPSETDLARIQDARAKGQLQADVYLPGVEPGRTGKLTFLDNTVDRLTGTIAARVTIANPDRSWLPGQYVRVRVHLGEQPDALMAPQIALGSSQLGKFLYVVGDDNKAQQQFVKLGATDGDLVVIVSGVAANDKIIVGNLQKIGPGSLVQPIPPQ